MLLVNGIFNIPIMKLKLSKKPVSVLFVSVSASFDYLSDPEHFVTSPFFPLS
jgi:hypothetical protein